MDWGWLKFENPLDVLGTLLAVLGVFLIVAGSGILTIKEIIVQPGRRTWLTGIGFLVLGLVFLFPHMSSRPTALTPTPASTVPPAATGISIQVPVPTFVLATVSPVPSLEPTATPLSPTPSPSPRLTSSPTDTASPVVILQTPEEFLHHYFELVTAQRDYVTAWNLLTPRFQEVTNSSGFVPYEAFWETIASVDLNHIDVMQLSSQTVSCAVDITYHKTSGYMDRTTASYFLRYDAYRQTWLFDIP